MFLPRIIPCLLLYKSGFVKTVKFKEPKYLGDPINIVKIFNEKEVDELIILDIASTVEKKCIQFELLEKVVSEAFMPVGYGGGVHKLEDFKRLLKLGIEKVIFNSCAVKAPEVLSNAADFAGSQSVVVSIDVKKNLWGNYEVRTHSGRITSKVDPISFAIQMEKIGAGELILNSIDRDGTMQGYDLELVHNVACAVKIPVVANGGARSLQDFTVAIKQGAAAVAAGSMFVFQGPHRAVLISYPSRAELLKAFESTS